MPTEVMASGNADVDGVLWGYKWTTTQLTYSFPTAVSGWPYAIAGFKSFSALQITAAMRALQNADNVSGLVLTKSVHAGDIRFGSANAINYLDAMGWHTPGFTSSAEGIPPDAAFKSYSHGHVWFFKGNFTDPRPGSLAFASGVLHELGHALGLKHGHSPQDSHFTTFPALPAQHDSQEYSVMTYNNYAGHEAQKFKAPLDFPTTYMQSDIAALQHMYGADYAFRAGNTTYKWSSTNGEMFVDGDGQGAPIRNKVFLTVWDGGGIDTFDFSNYRTGVRADLAPGHWSTPSSAQKAYLGDAHYARGCIATALLYHDDPRSLIENCIGGAGNDFIAGNAARNLLGGGAGRDTLMGAKGDDVLRGGAGNDSLIGGPDSDALFGGEGADRFIFNTALSGLRQFDRIGDFDPDDDTIVLEDAVFTGLARKGQGLWPAQFFAGRGPHDGNDRLIYNPATGVLLYDVNGNEAGGSAVVCVLAKHLVLKAADFAII